jgi:hypothetical protein
MVGADDVVLSVIIISSVQNFLFDLFFEVMLEEAVVYTRQYLPDFSIPGFNQTSIPGFNESSMTADGAGLHALIEQLSLTPQLVDKLSVEQLEMLNTVLVAMQAAG